MERPPVAMTRDSQEKSSWLVFTTKPSPPAGEGRVRGVFARRVSPSPRPSPLEGEGEGGETLSQLHSRKNSAPAFRHSLSNIWTISFADLSQKSWPSFFSW